MNSLTWRGLVVLGAAALAIFAAYPPDKKINLGLDLQGGIHLVLQVETQDALRSETDKDMERLRQELGDKGVTATTERTGDTAFRVGGVALAQEPVAAKAAQDFLVGWDWRRNGEDLNFTMEAPHAKQLTEMAINQALQTIRNRIDEFGVAEPVIARQGLDSNRIVVQLPGVDDPERVKRLIKNTAFLEFRLVDFPRGGGAGVSSREAVLQNYGGQLPGTVEILSEDTRDKLGRLTGQSFYGIEKKRVITGRDLRSAAPGSGQFNQPIVHFSLTPDGARLFGDATGANVGRGLAIILDGKVMSAPVINSRISDSGIIEGRFTQQEVQDLVTVLRSGALPAGITYLEDRTVGPSLGADSVRSGLRAGLVGALLVVFCMLIVYMGAGVYSIAMLVVNILLIFGGLAYFGATLTLPGIAGIVLTVGMAVDASVLIFERIREEMDTGRTVKAAIDAGFGNAMSSIVDANITTLIAALFLFQFGTGPVRGFAVTLSIGILGTLFAMVFGGRWLFDLKLARNPRIEKLSI